MIRNTISRHGISFGLVLILSVLIAVPAAVSRQNHQTAPPATARLAGKNLIIITLDTTRADYISCYGGPKDLTPHIDALASDGTLFLHGNSQTNCTNPSHTAILTGLYAIDSKIFNNQTTLAYVSPEVDTLPLVFQRAGYRTAGFPATPHLSREILDIPGFDHYPQVPVGGGFDAAQIVDNVIEWLNKPSDKPFFAWVHFFDPHMKYWPPEEYRSLYYPKDKDPYAGEERPFSEDDNFNRSPDIVKDQFSAVRDRAYPPALYKGEIRYTDDQVGRLIRHLKSAGLYDKTGIVLVADHGESLGDHDVYYDHYGLFEPCIRIPFIMYMPGMPAGRRVVEPVTHVDIVPTIAALYGVRIEQHAPMHGINLAPTLAGEPNPALSEQRITVHEDAYNRQVMARKGPWKLIQMVPDAGPKYNWPNVMLFNVESDPQEKTNLLEKNAEVRAELATAIKPWIELGKWNIKNPKGEDNAKDKAARAELEARLKAMGYTETDDQPDEKPASTLTLGEFEDLILKKLDLKLTAEQRKKIEQSFAQAKSAVKKASAETDKTLRTELGRKARAQVYKDVAVILSPEQNQVVNEAVRKRMNTRPGAASNKE